MSTRDNSAKVAWTTLIQAKGLDKLDKPAILTPIEGHCPPTPWAFHESYLYNNNQYNLQFGATCSLLVSFGIHLSTSKGEILGGAIDGNVIPGDDVNITLSTFSHPEIYNCVPKGEEEDDGDKNNNNNNY
ncbi:hypothetical protein JHK82_055224 [Glycine max]|nr:hypothetical protein JHK85_056037 [Glycine max]KAG5073853.1 hypothetical protein JHK84_055084 [Glycine max]KAG5076529.1 hypothetical protein JHK82_055224 [Glycine max]